MIILNRAKRKVLVGKTLYTGLTGILNWNGYSLMIVLAVANLMQRKVRSILSVLAVAFAIALMLILWGLSHGTLEDVSSRMKSVQAEIVVRDRNFDLGSMSGGKLWEKEIPRIMAVKIGGKQAVERVIPVFLGRMKLAGLSQNVFGVKPDDFKYFCGSRRIVTGHIFKDVKSASDFIQLQQEHISQDMPQQTLQDTDKSTPQSDTAVTSATKTPAVVMPVIIDERLARAGHLQIGNGNGNGDSNGSKLGNDGYYGDVPIRIVGIVQTGVAGRVFAPINILRAVNGISASTAHMFFVKAVQGLSNAQLQQLCEAIHKATHRNATLVANYSQVLAKNFKSITIFVNLVSLIALVICFLFILVTMYTMVLERGREIAILQSLGAGRRAILRQTMQEAFLICSTGTLVGIAITLGVRRLVETLQPLMTIDIRWQWMVLAVLIGLGGGCLSAVYPSYLALRHDPVEALSFE